MLGSSSPKRLLVALLLFAAFAPLRMAGQAADGEAVNPPSTFPTKATTLSFGVEWRLINAGTAILKLTPGGTSQYPSLHSELTLTSAGLVSKLYKVNDKYFGNYDPGFCATSVQMTSEEGRRRRDTRVTYERARKKASYLERDLVKNAIVKQDEIDIPSCVHDVLAALLQLRTMHVEPGSAVELPVSDGKKFANVRIEGQERENVTVNNTAYKTIRYEAFIMNGVIYPRKARLQLWLTDDARKLPVQIRLRMNFPIGTVSLTLDKVE